MVDRRMVDRHPALFHYLLVFKDESPARAAIVDGPDRLKMQKHAFHSTRQAVRATFKSGDIEFVQEYANLPTVLVRTSRRAAFVKLLNNQKVVSVTENVSFRHHMAESLPLIRQPMPAWPAGPAQGPP